MANGIQDSIIGVFNTIFPGNTQAGVFKWDVPKSGVPAAKPAPAAKAPASAAVSPAAPSVGAPAAAPARKPATGTANSSWLTNMMARLNRPGQSQGERVGIMSTILSKLGYGTQGRFTETDDSVQEEKRHLMIKGRIVQ